MAAVTVANLAKHVTLTAATADTITLPSNDVTVEVFNHDGSAYLFVRADGTAATVDGDNTYKVPPNSGIRLRPNEIKDAAAGQLSVISSAAAAYSVTVV